MAPMRFSVSVQADDFDIGTETRHLTSGNTNIGAVASFTGFVRGSENGISQMDLEHYPGMTERALENILDEARSRWPLAGARIVHRIGELAPGEQIVLVLAASRHRQAAFDAASFMMDFLKTQAPFWKREHSAQGARWVDARDSDDAAMTRWERDKG